MGQRRARRQHSQRRAQAWRAHARGAGRARLRRQRYCSVHPFRRGGGGINGGRKGLWAVKLIVGGVLFVALKQGAIHLYPPKEIIWTWWVPGLVAPADPWPL